MSDAVMHSGIWLWLAFLLTALATHIPGSSFIVAGSRAKMLATSIRLREFATCSIDSRCRVLLK